MLYLCAGEARKSHLHYPMMNVAGKEGRSDDAISWEPCRYE